MNYAYCSLPNTNRKLGMLKKFRYLSWIRRVIQVWIAPASVERFYEYELIYFDGTAPSVIIISDF